MIRRRIFPRIGMLLITLIAATLAAPSAVTPPASTISLVKATLAADVSRWSAPGLSAAIVIDHRLVWSGGLGLADLEQRVPATSATVYRIASISKTITAVAVMQLAERAALDLDAPIQRYCPAFPKKPWPITARQLLGHLGGIRHYRNTDEFFSTRHYTDLVQPLGLFKDDPLLHEPGTKFSYTTYGYNVLGCAIEGASGMTYVDYIRAHILRPAGMRHTQPDDVYAIVANRARTYRKEPNGEVQNAPLADTSNKIPGGGWCSMAEDLAKFAIALQTGSLVTKAALAQMFTRQKTRDSQDIPFGLGWVIDVRNGRKEVWHLGGGQGVSTILFMRPEHGVAVSLLVNLGGLSTPSATAPTLDLARRIADLVSSSP
jgi:serine beta-lactamase-like protein LACTB, mitochondrial